jgi:fructose-specific phosphotransferase system IIA component
MRLSDILHPNCVKVPLEAEEKHGAIDELIDVLAQQELVADPAPLKEAVWEREQTRTTGIGQGIAIPHGKSEGIDQLRCAIGKAAQPLEFGAIDGQPVDLIILLASPVDQTGPHIQALAKISRMLTEDTFRAALKQADSPKSLYDQIITYEGQVTV